MPSKLMLVIVGLCITVVFAILLYYKTQTTWIESKPYVKQTNTTAKTLVVVYSRTGNTLAAAKEAAKYFDADLLTIEAPAYDNDLKGLKQASDDASEQMTSTPIEHRPVDLSQYDLIILCSPTWWFRPAVPLWSFVENHSFMNKHVFLLMTGNSRYKENMIRDFQNLVETKNGIYLDMLFIQRGRIYWQKNADEVNNEVLEALQKRRDLWQDIFNK